MISLSLAKRLKDSGLVWPAKVNDFFAVPDRDMDDRIFVVSDLQANLGIFRGWPVVTFHGSAEWALDYILTTEVVWLPREEQLQHSILKAFPDDAIKSIQLNIDGQTTHCSLVLADETISVDAPTVSAAYGQILLLLLERHVDEPPSTTRRL